MAMSGIACSSTSQALIPPGLLTSRISNACAATPRANQSIAARRWTENRRRNMGFPQKLVGSRLGQHDAGHGTLEAQIFLRDTLDLVRGDGGQLIGIAEHVADRAAGRESSAEQLRQARLAVGGIDNLGAQTFFRQVQL